MQISLPTSPAAPLVSGHPFGLPAAPARSPDPKRVEATDAASSGNLGARRTPAPSAEEELAKVLENPGDHIAPPSIMQLRIAALLDGGTGPADTPPDAAAANYASGLDR